jgi:ATP-binding cassette subfamily B protein
MILDEPTAALDPIAENDMYLKYNQITEGKTSIFISHRLSSTCFCDQILFLSDGTISEKGSHEELMNKSGAYAQMFQLQSYYYNLQNEV